MRKFLPFILLVIVGERASGRKKVFIWRFIIHNRLIIFLGLHLGKSSRVAKTNLVSLRRFSRGINLCLFGVLSFTIQFCLFGIFKVLSKKNKFLFLIHNLAIQTFLSLVVVLPIPTFELNLLS